METPLGTIVSIAERAGDLCATIEVDVAAVCPRCAAGKGCGAGVLGANRGKKRVVVVIDPGLHLNEGDQVQLTLAANNILRASMIVYGIPMLGAVIGAAAAYGLSLGDLGAAMAAIGGLGGGLLFSRRQLHRTDCLREFTPTVARPG
jgi:sigma-E factor negative regulatory protein RseC